MRKMIEVGSLVEVGERFEMGHNVGQGRKVADEYTGRRFVVVRINTSYSGPPNADLAPADLIGADESDAVVNIVCRRLTAL